MKKTLTAWCVAAALGWGCTGTVEAPGIGGGKGSPPEGSPLVPIATPDGGAEAPGVVCPVRPPLDLTLPGVKEACTKTVVVAAGHAIRRIARAEGDVNWTNVEDSQDGKGQDEHAISGAAVGNGVIVTVGDGGALVSTDGKTWTRIEALPRWPQLHSSKVAFADGRFIVVGNGGTWTSPDGMAWVGVTGDAALPGGDADGNPIPGGFSGHVGAWAAGDGKVLFTNDNALYRLFDGARWYQAKLGNYAGWLNSAAFGNGRFVMTGETCCNMQSPTSGGLRTASTDGRTWPTIITNESGEYLSFGNLVWDGTRFYAASGTDALVSQDGLTWSQVAMSANLREATFFEGTYYGTDGRHIYTSADGRAWTRIYEGAEGSWYLGTLVVGRILK